MTEHSSIESTPATIENALRLFNERDFFACHDILEELWGGMLGEDRDFLQGLLHVAVSLHHLSEGNPAGARKMHVSSLRYLSGYGPRYGGVDLEQLRAELRTCFEPLLNGVPAGFVAPLSETLPMLRWSPKDE